MKVLIYGAGVIGQVYGGRLAQAGNDVTLLARGQAAGLLAERGITLREGSEVSRVRPRVVTQVAPSDSFDLMLVTVRRDQLAAALPALAEAPAERVVLMLNQGADMERVRDRIGAERALFGFPGIGGQLTDAGDIEFLQVPQQKTTLERHGGREAPIAAQLRAAGFAVQLAGDMASWLTTHEVFISAVGGAILASGGDSRTLAADRPRVAEMVTAVGEGFRALTRQGITVTPAALRLIFTVVPRFAAIRYWQRQLNGPLGTMAIAPHMRASRFTEFPLISADVRQLMAGQGPVPHLERLLSAADQPSSGPAA